MATCIIHAHLTVSSIPLYPLCVQVWGIQLFLKILVVLLGHHQCLKVSVTTLLKFSVQHLLVFTQVGMYTCSYVDALVSFVGSAAIPDSLLYV
jgi:hypothetical protein